MPGCLVPPSAGRNARMASTGAPPGGKLKPRRAVLALDDAIARAMRHVSGRVDVVVRSEADGRKRFVEVVNHLRNDRDDMSSRSTLSEGRLAKALLAPADVEPDLVLVLGPPTQLPTSLVWEMAYSELVFLDIGWNDLSEEHLLMAVDDYRRRNRRFGGIDA